MHSFFPLKLIKIFFIGEKKTHQKGTKTFARIRTVGQIIKKNVEFMTCLQHLMLSVTNTNKCLTF